jgi:mRNA interferase MazF
MAVQRGEIWWASLATPRDSSPGFRRPILIVQADDFNRSRISTVVAAVITSNLVLAKAPGNVRIPARASGLKKASVVNVSQIITVDKSYLTERVGTLKLNYMKEVDDGLRLMLAIS